MAATSSVIVVDDERVREGSRYKPNTIRQVDDTVHSAQKNVDQLFMQCCTGLIDLILALTSIISLTGVKRDSHGRAREAIEKRP
jgi:hypothetical protein